MNHFVVEERSILSSSGSRRRLGFSGSVSATGFFALALFVLVVFWFISFCLLTWNLQLYLPGAPPAVGGGNTNIKAIGNGNISTHQQPHLPDFHVERPLQPHILSRIPGKVTATADVRGNLGPASVVIQPLPGTDWIHDRWQAASDMHGKNIPGEHWILLEFQSPIVVDYIRLDWETAYASDYRIEGSMKRIDNDDGAKEQSVIKVGRREDDIWTLFDTSSPEHLVRRTEEKTGQSPGVKQKMPLHVIHTIQCSVSNHSQSQHPMRFLRLHILKSATGWGVSLWQFDVMGFWKNEVVM